MVQNATNHCQHKAVELVDDTTLERSRGGKTIQTDLLALKTMLISVLCCAAIFSRCCRARHDGVRTISSA